MQCRMVFLLQTFRNNLSVPSSWVKQSKKKVGPIGFSETSVTVDQSTLHKIPKEIRSQLYRAVKYPLFLTCNVYGSVHRKYIPIYISNKMQLCTVYLYLETVVHVSVGTSTHHQERLQLYLQRLVFVTPLLLPAAIATDSSNGVTNTRSCKYTRMRSWLWVEVPPELCKAVSRYK
jgi:hypothetical protein